MICCPNCGYEMVDATRSRLVGWLNKLWPQGAARTQGKREPHAVHRPLVLSQAPLRINLRIESVEGLAPQIQARLSVLGLLPGAEVQLLQRRPAPVVRVGETELAIGLELLENVRVSEVPCERL
jgi:Fe2+ transport system protein FeoA